MSEQFREYVQQLNKLKEKSSLTNKRFFNFEDFEPKYKSFYGNNCNVLSTIDLSSDTLFIDANIDTYVKWLLKEGF